MSNPPHKATTDGQHTVQVVEQPRTLTKMSLRSRTQLLQSASTEQISHDAPRKYARTYMAKSSLRDNIENGLSDDEDGILTLDVWVRILRATYSHNASYKLLFPRIRDNSIESADLIAYDSVPPETSRSTSIREFFLMAVRSLDKETGEFETFKDSRTRLLCEMEIVMGENTGTTFGAVANGKEVVFVKWCPKSKSLAPFGNGATLDLIDDYQLITRSLLYMIHNH